MNAVLRAMFFDLKSLDVVRVIEEDSAGHSVNPDLSDASVKLEAKMQ